MKKLIMITGASAGIGKAAALKLAQQGHKLILVGRNPLKLKNVTEEIKHLTDNHEVNNLIADFSDLKQVQKLVLDVRNNFDSIDVLVNNAGGYFITRQVTSIGVEKTFLVNYLSSFLLTNSLLPNMTDTARIINVASAWHYTASLDLNDLSSERFYFGLSAYGRSKLANILFTYELAHRLKDRSISVNALHPGRVGTDIFKTNFPYIGTALKWFMSHISLTPEEGADNTVYLADSSEINQVTGKYFVRREAIKSSSLSYDTELAKKLWDVSQKLTQPFTLSPLETGFHTTERTGH